MQARSSGDQSSGGAKLTMSKPDKPLLFGLLSHDFKLL